MRNNGKIWKKMISGIRVVVVVVIINIATTAALTSRGACPSPLDSPLQSTALPTELSKGEHWKHFSQ